MKRTYENNHIRVFWDSDLCTHAAACVTELPAVFNTRRRPWVDINGALPDDIARVVEDCPSGALRYEFLDRAHSVANSAPASVRVSDGPYVVTGDCRLIDKDGREIEVSRPFSLCRCGRSKNMPFCDGSHAHPDKGPASRGTGNSSKPSDTGKEARP